MKIAYLILTHVQPRMFSRLVNALDVNGAQFFVHVDLKANLTDFTNSCNLTKTTFISERIWVYYGGFSQVKAILKLLEAATSRGGFDYYIFLSGQDYPLKSNDYIFEFLTEYAGTNFINFYPLVGDAYFTQNILKYYLIDEKSGFNTYAQGIIKACLNFANLMFPDRSFIKGLIPYRGSTSWCLTETTARYIVDFVNSPKNKKYMKFFKYALFPEEVFFQTIILNSPLAQQCRFYERDIVRAKRPMKNENKAYLHYIDWSDDREDPAVLDMRDYQVLKTTDKLFARKFDEHRSKALIDNIDEFR